MGKKLYNPKPLVTTTIPVTTNGSYQIDVNIPNNLSSQNYFFIIQSGTLNFVNPNGPAGIGSSQDLVLWLDGKDIFATGENPSASTPVYQWKDKSNKIIMQPKLIKFRYLQVQMEMREGFCLTGAPIFMNLDLMLFLFLIKIEPYLLP